MRILVISPRKAWPPTSGARLRDFYFARYLAARFPLTYLYLGGDEDAAETRRQISARSVESITPPRRYTYRKILRGLSGRMPLPVLNYTSPEMGAAIRNALKQEHFDVVHLESLHLAAYLPEIKRWAPHAITVLDWHNIESELMNRYATAADSVFKAGYARFTARRLYDLERSLLAACNGHIVCSGREQALLASRDPSARIALIENGVDTKRFRPASNLGQGVAARKLVFVGQMSYHANVEAAAWFVREVWPAVRAHFPQLQLSLVGSDPTAEVLALADGNSIEVTGTVPDVLPHYQDAFVSVVPLQTGGGTRLKILEAMAAGTPVISTAAGAEGLRVTHGEHIWIANQDPQSWLTALSAVARAETRDALTAKARELVCTHYDWESIGNRLADTYQQWLQELSREPAAA